MTLTPGPSGALVRDFLEQSADRSPDKLALICGAQRLTYAGIEAQANRLANALRAAGFARGERAILRLPNSVELVIAIFAVLKAGGVFVVVNPSVKYDKLAYMLDNCRAAVFVTQDSHETEALQLSQGRSWLRTVVLADGPAMPAGGERFLSYGAIQREVAASRPPRANIDSDLACLIYTSGSTGDPKGVMSDHSNMVFAADSIIHYLGNTPDDIVIDVLPLSFDYGLYQLLMVFRFGGALVLEKGFAYPAAVLQRIAGERVTGFPGVPTLFALLLKMDLGRYDLSSLRYVTNTAAALPPSHIVALREKFSQARLFSMYGLTETKRTLYLPPEELDIRPASVGIPIPGTEAWLEDEHGNRLGPGEVGELVVRGRHVMRGYWGDPGLTAKRFRPGPVPGERLCYTGDLFRMDEEGRFYFVSRQDDIIKSSGEKVAPKEVENVLYGLEGVTEAAVIGIPDPVLGQAIVAFLVLDKAYDLREKEILAYCTAHLENYMVPRYVQICEQLPKTSSGKIQKSALSYP